MATWSSRPTAGAAPRNAGRRRWPTATSAFPISSACRPTASSVERLTYNKDVDRYPHCLNNGLIGYMRWDYQERFWQWPHALWTIRPDGTMNDGLFKVHFNDPQSVREPRSIPGSQQAGGDRLAAITRRRKGRWPWSIRRWASTIPLGLRYVTPACSPLEGGLGSSPTVPEGGVPDRGGLYRTPWPLSEKGFLVSYAYHHPRQHELCGLLHRRVGKQGVDSS